DIFTDVGRLSGKPKDRRLTEQERSHLQTYLLTNCEDVLQYERIFMAEKRFEYRYATEEELEEMKQRDFSGWMLTYVSAGMTRGETFDDWIREMVRGAEYVVKSYPRFCTRGYAFTTQKRRRSSTTYDAGVCSASGDDVYYGNIPEIMEIKYPDMVGLRYTISLTFGPSENPCVESYRMVLKTHPVSVHRRSWSTEENETLAKGSSDDIETINESIKNLEITPEMIRQFLPEVNWDQLASMYFKDRSAAGMWMSSEDPLINHGPWTAEEENNLRLIIQEKGLQTGLTLLFH
ncbi:unnamed protein product, partial [Brassica oleracea var. botrytis]